MSEYTGLLTLAGGKWVLLVKDARTNIVDQIFIDRETSGWRVPSNKRVLYVVNKSEKWKYLGKEKHTPGVFRIESIER